MMYSASASRLGSEFNDFLFASIGAEKNGMLLSVLSALARLDIDPWQEAAKLARLPGETATQRLAALIAELPDEPSADPDPVTIAARLIALLPRPTDRNIPSRKAAFGAGVATHLRAVMYMYVIVMVFALGFQWIAASRQPATPVDSVHAPASSTVSPPQVQPPNAGQ